MAYECPEMLGSGRCNGPHLAGASSATAAPIDTLHDHRPETNEPLHKQSIVEAMTLCELPVHYLPNDGRAAHSTVRHTTVRAAQACRPICWSCPGFSCCGHTMS